MKKFEEEEGGVPSWYKDTFGAIPGQGGANWTTTQSSSSGPVSGPEGTGKGRAASRGPCWASLRDANRATLLHEAIQLPEAPKNRPNPVVRMLLQYPKAPSALDLQDEKGKTALHRCARQGRPGAARLILELGASPDIPDLWQATPLLEATREGETPPFLGVAEALLDHNADANVMTLSSHDHGVTPLVMAVRSKDKAMVRLLLAKAKNLDLGQRTLKGVPF